MSDTGPSIFEVAASCSERSSCHWWSGLSSACGRAGWRVGLLTGAFLSSCSPSFGFHDPSTSCSGSASSCGPSEAAPAAERWRTSHSHRGGRMMRCSSLRARRVPPHAGPRSARMRSIRTRSAISRLHSSINASTRSRGRVSLIANERRRPSSSCCCTASDSSRTPVRGGTSERADRQQGPRPSGIPHDGDVLCAVDTRGELAVLPSSCRLHRAPEHRAV